MTRQDAESAASGGEAFEAWLKEREPAAPGPLLGMLLEDGCGDPTLQRLQRCGEAALARALESPGRARQGAFDLLVGDAFITYACEALCGSEDPANRLRTLLVELGEGFSR